jgi:hypothetical protein
MISSINNQAESSFIITDPNTDYYDNNQSYPDDLQGSGQSEIAGP